jgi:hypothetical protein
MWCASLSAGRLEYIVREADIGADADNSRRLQMWMTIDADISIYSRTLPRGPVHRIIFGVPIVN